MRSSRSVIALDASLGEWQILLPLPEGMSRLKVYGALQEIIKDLELSLTVDRIVLVKQDDPGLRELRDNSLPYVRHLGIGQDPIDVAGRLFVEPREMRVDPRFFERQIFDLLQSGLSGDVHVMTGLEASRASVAEFAPESASLRASRAMRYADIVVFGRGAIILVETKSARYPVPMSVVLSGFGLLAYIQRVLYTHSTVSMIFVSASGFTPQAERDLSGLNDFHLVSWGDAEADLRIVSTVRQIL